MMYENAMLESVRRVARQLAKREHKLSVPCFQNEIDLFTTDDNLSSIKFRFRIRSSRDYLTATKGQKKVYEAPRVPGWRVHATSWFTFKQIELRNPHVDYFVLIVGHNINRPVYVVIKPADLLARLTNIYGNRASYDVYLCIAGNRRVFDWRGLGQRNSPINPPQLIDTDRDYSICVDNWPSC